MPLWPLLYLEMVLHAQIIKFVLFFFFFIYSIILICTFLYQTYTLLFECESQLESAMTNTWNISYFTS